MANYFDQFDAAETQPTRVTVRPNPQPLDITPPSIDPRARDLAIRTIYGEASGEGEEGQAAVAHVIRNRVQAGRYGGRDVGGVVMAPHQFEPWGNTSARDRMMRLRPDSPDYQRIGAIVDRVFSGEGGDPTQGATHFFAPIAQNALGRRPPSWAQGDPIIVGRHNFYAPEGRVGARGPQRTADGRGIVGVGPLEEPSEPATQAQAGNFFDQFDTPAGETFDARFKGEPSSAPANPALTAGLERVAREKTTGPKRATTMERVAGDYLNQGPAAAQRTTPNIEAHYPNIVSADVHENDAGQLLYRDATGQMLPVDPAKHVVLRDPTDKTVKVFNRTEDTNEGTLSSLGRIMMSGMGANAPTRVASAANGVGPWRSQAPLAAAQPARPGQAVADAAARIDVNVPRAVTTDSVAAQRLAGVVRNVPGAGDPLISATERTVKQLGQRADEVSQAFGSGNTQAAGDAASTGIKNWITGTSAANATKLYDKVDELVNPTVTTPLRNTQQAVNKIEGMRELAASPGESGAVAQVAKALQRSEGLTYEGLKRLREGVGELLDNKLIPPNISEKELRAIYGALSVDLRAAVANAGGGQAISAFERANNYFRLASERRDALAKIVGSDGNQPVEAVFSRLVGMAGSNSRADIVKLTQARKAMGAEDWNEFVSGIVANMGRNPTMRGAPEALEAANFSPERFLSAYSKLSPEGRAVLFRSTGQGDLARVLDDIAAVSTRFKELQKFSNPSGTGQTVLGGLGVAGLFADPLTTISSVVGGRAMAYMLSKPATAAPVAQWSRAYSRAVESPTPAAIAHLNLASRNLINNMGDKFGTFTPNDFLRSIQGPVRAPAEQEQP